ncbi:MAG: DUF2007 domain-containing protein [Pseudomonadota bacterium]
MRQFGGKALEEVFRTNDLVKLSYIRHLLSEEGIEPFVLDEHTAMIDGRGPMIPIRITVREDLAERARFVLREVERDA